jgi:polysaccharide biosynthesis/export protein
MARIAGKLQQVAWIVCLLLGATYASLTLAAASSDYKVGAGDLLKISVFNYPDLATDARVSQSGNITFPLVGLVPVTGLSTREAETLLTRRLTDGGFIRDAQVSVLVVEYQSQKISVMGQVAKPGQYALTQANKAMDLLAAAGGVVIGAAGDEAMLLRSNGSKARIDLQAMFDGDPAQNPAVASGDTLYVPRAPQFYIYGEVQRPGVYRLERRMTLMQAISAAGGLTPRASERRVVVTRKDAKTGKDVKTGIAASDLLEPDDVVTVKQALF